MTASTSTNGSERPASHDAGRTDGVYLDHNATTPLASEALEAMQRWFTEGFGNPSSVHARGQACAKAVARARSQVADLFGAIDPGEIVFTSGGTEGLNTSLWTARQTLPERRTLVISGAEHPAIKAPAERFAREGYVLRTTPVDGQGRLEVEAALAAIDDDTALVSLLWANNETGVVIPREALVAIGERARQVGALFHLDAVQVAGKLPLDVAGLPVDLASISGHKFHGPLGTGALYVREGLEVAALLEGGGQEQGRRGGTTNTPGVVGLGVAAELARQGVELERKTGQVAALRDHLERELERRVGPVVVHGAEAERVPHTSNTAFLGLKNDALLLLLSELGVYVSAGSACSSGKRASSPVLTAMGIAPEEAGATLRLSLSRETTRADIELALERIEAAVSQLRRLQPAGT